MQQLLQLLEAPGALSQDLIADISKMLKMETVKKKQMLLEIGKVSNRVYFIGKGLFRGYEIYKGCKNSIWFMVENDLMFAVSSFYSGLPSKEGIEALEKGEVYSIAKSELLDMYKKHIQFNWNGRILTEKYYQRTWPDMQRLRMRTAEERYGSFRLQHPDLEVRIPPAYLASFLGMSTDTLYRCRKRYNKAHRR